MYRNWTRLQHPTRLKFIDKDDQTGTLTVEPLERGFGHTIGNALKRVLLTSFSGMAITSVIIDGVLPTSTTIPNVVDDLQDVLLNIKGIVIASDNNAPVTLTLTTSGAGTFTAGHINCPDGVTVLNPDHYIATVTDVGALQILMTVEIGMGYVAAYTRQDIKEPNTLWLDTSFSPVKTVKHSSSSARIGDRTDYDKLELEITTNGVLAPITALKEAVKTLTEQLNVFINFDESQFVIEAEPVTETTWDRNLFIKVIDFELSVRGYNALESANIKYVGDLVHLKLTELQKMPKVGRKTVSEIEGVLTSHGLKFGMTIDDWPPEDVDELARKYALEAVG
jgi:DNA-directed RNA polymerase subunit alpha